MLKDVVYSPKLQTSLISQSKAPKAEISIKYKPGSTNILATLHGNPVLWGDSKEAVISELVRMTQCTLKSLI